LGKYVTVFPLVYKYSAQNAKIEFFYKYCAGSIKIGLKKNIQGIVVTLC